MQAMGKIMKCGYKFETASRQVLTVNSGSMAVVNEFNRQTAQQAEIIKSANCPVAKMTFTDHSSGDRLM